MSLLLCPKNLWIFNTHIILVSRGLNPYYAGGNLHPRSNHHDNREIVIWNAKFLTT